MGASSSRGVAKRYFQHMVTETRLASLQLLQVLPLPLLMSQELTGIYVLH